MIEIFKYKTVHIIFNLFLLFRFLLIPAAAGGDELWQRALDIREKNQHWAAGRMTINTLEYGNAGEIKNTETIVYALRPGGTEASDYYIVSAHKNGKDITSEKQKENQRQRNSAGSGDSGPQENPDPFDRSVQDRMTIIPTGKTMLIKGILCEEYSFKLPGEKLFSYSGTAWIDIKTGVPLLVETILDPKPAFVSEFHMTTRYSEREDQWYPVEITMKAAGTLLFIKREYLTTLTFSGYLNRNVGN